MRKALTIDHRHPGGGGRGDGVRGHHRTEDRRDLVAVPQQHALDHGARQRQGGEEHHGDRRRSPRRPAHSVTATLQSRLSTSKKWVNGEVDEPVVGRLLAQVEGARQEGQVQDPRARHALGHVQYLGGRRRSPSSRDGPGRSGLDDHCRKGRRRCREGAPPARSRPARRPARRRGLPPGPAERVAPSRRSGRAAVALGSSPSPARRRLRRPAAAGVTVGREPAQPPFEHVNARTWPCVLPDGVRLGRCAHRLAIVRLGWCTLESGRMKH